MAGTDINGQTPAQLSAPHAECALITPNDGAQQPTGMRGIYVGGAGNIALRLWNDTTDTLFTGVPAGTVLRVCPRFIRATGTTATNMVALF
jgi:hypothetical protein